MAKENGGGKGLLTKESIQRTVKSKWFLPALAVGGAIVVLLVLSRRKGAGTAAGEELYPATQPTEGGAPSTFDLSSLQGQIADLFGAYQGGIDKQIQQQNEAIQSAMTEQSKYLESSITGLQGQLEGAVSQLQSSSGNVPYYDPYAGYGYDPYASYGVTGYGDEFVTEPFIESSSGLDYGIPTEADSYGTPHASLIAETKTGRASEQSTIKYEPIKTSIQPLSPELRDSSGGKVNQPVLSQLTPRTATGTAKTETKPLSTGTSQVVSAGVPGGLGAQPIRAIASQTPSPIVSTTPTYKNYARPGQPVTSQIAAVTPPKVVTPRVATPPKATPPAPKPPERPTKPTVARGRTSRTK